MDTPFLLLAFNYLHTAENILEQMINDGNPHFIISNSEINNYHELTKWSDFNVMIPTLFLFFHGLELIIKGLLFLEKASEDVTDNHNIEGLFQKLETYYNNHKLLDLIKKYVHGNSRNTPKLIKGILNTNQHLNNIEDLYQFLRYPTNRGFEDVHNYIQTKYKEKEGLLFAQELKEDIHNLRLIVGQLYRDKKNL